MSVFTVFYQSVQPHFPWKIRFPDLALLIIGNPAGQQSPDSKRMFQVVQGLENLLVVYF